MVYYFKHSNPDAATTLRRIALDQIDKAIVSANRHDGLHEGIHDARKKCKKLRGLIRLVRPAFPAYAAENVALRDAARLLSPLRERGAGIETLNRLLVTRAGDIDRNTAEIILDALATRATAAAIDDLDTRLAGFRADLSACRRRIAGWTLDKTGFSAIEGGLHGTYARARKAMRIAHKTRLPQDMHNWRKQVKYHWYHARLLKPLKPARLKPRIAQARDLSDLLGDHHDLIDFCNLLESGTLPVAASEALLGPVATDTVRLEEAAFDLGRELLAEKPTVHIMHWRDWWNRW